MAEEKVSADTDDLWSFVENGQTYVSKLESMAGGVEDERQAAQRALAEFETPLSSGLSLEELIVEARNNNEFVSDLYDSLKASGVEADGITTASAADIDEALRAAGHSMNGLDLSLAEDKAYRERLARDDVIDAMVAGQTPEEAGLPAEYFPLSYRGVHSNDAIIDRLETEREVADGGWGWWDEDGERIEQIDGQLDDRNAHRHELASTIGANDQGRLTEVEAIAALGDWTGDREWEGEQYGHWTNDYYETNVSELSDGTIKLDHDGADDLGDEFAFIGERIAGEPTTAVGFYNEIGVEGAAYLPTLLVDAIPASDNDELLDAAFADYGIALGEASRQQNDDGSPALTFTGDELIREPLPTRLTNRHVHDEVYHQAFLFASGEFDQQFLVDATVESLIQAEEDPLATNSIQFVWTEGVPFQERGSGEDPRNILLARSSEDVDTTAAVVEQLWQGPGSVSYLLSPSVPFSGSFTGDHVYHPVLGSEYPITTFLHQAALDDQASFQIITSAAQNPDVPFSDEGVASGVDGILAHHATIMYPDEALEAVGIEHTGINDLPPTERTRGDSDITAEMWRATHGKVLDYGRGELLMAKTNQLIDEAIEGAIIDGEFDASLVDPFATIAGAVGSETSEALFAYYANLDDEARAYNQKVNIAASAGFAVLGLAPGAWGAIPAFGGVAFTAWDPLSVPTDSELQALRDHYAQMQVAGQDRSTRWANIIYDGVLAHGVETGGIELRVPGTDEPQIVPIQKQDGTYQWQHPETDEWSDFPPFADDEYEELLDDTALHNATSDTVFIHRDYVDGVIFAADDHDDVAERRAMAGIDVLGDRPTSTKPDDEVDEAELRIREESRAASRERIRSVEEAADQLQLKDWIASD